MRRTKEDAEKTRSAILNAAEELFLQNGVAQTSLEHIARAANVTRGAIYWHFANKADLFHALINQVRLPLEQFAQRLHVNEQHPILPLREVCIEGINSLLQENRRRRIFTILLHRCEMTEELRPAQERHLAFINEFIHQCELQFAEAQKRGLLQPNVTPYTAAQALHALVVGTLVDITRQPSDQEYPVDPYGLIDALLRGLLVHWNPDQPQTQALIC